MAASLISTNKWPVRASQNGLAVIKYVTGKVAPGDPHVILNYLCERYNAEVEPIRKGDSWGWAYRPVRGKSSGFSNHASGTAVDINATTHGMWKKGTFTAKQKAAVRRILADIGGPSVVFWGEDYRVRTDGMHFEINSAPGSAAVRAAANKIRALNGNYGLPTAPAKPAPAPSKDTRRPFSLANVVNARAHRWRHANIAIVQAALNKHYLVHKQGRLTVDGWWGSDTQRVFDAYRLRVMKLTRVEDYTGAPGLKSVQHLLADTYKVS